jgi:hypothetical protein
VFRITKGVASARRRKRDDLDIRKSLCMSLCMPSRTISVDEEAYERLCKARRDRSDSFSKVIKRATWHTAEPTCGSVLGRLARLPAPSEAILDALDAAQRNEAQPEDKWSR